MKTKKIAVCLWLFHEQLREEYFQLLHPLREYIDLFLGLPKDCNCNDQTIKLFANSFSNISINLFNNEGADVLPFLYQLEQIIDKYEYCIKIHSKKSKWGVYRHCEWRAMLLNDLIGSPTILANNLYKLENNQYNMLGNKFFIFHDRESFHTNKIIEIMQSCDIVSNSKDFCAGTMFMSKCSNLRVFLDHFDYIHSLLSQETSKVKEKKTGTYCHAMERVFGYVSNIGASDIPILKIQSDLTNQLTSEPFLNLVYLYNNQCYIQENAHIYGNIIDHHPEYFDIYWLHITDSSKQKKYRYFKDYSNTHKTEFYHRA